MRLAFGSTSPDPLDFAFGGSIVVPIWAWIESNAISAAEVGTRPGPKPWTVLKPDAAEECTPPLLKAVGTVGVDDSRTKGPVVRSFSKPNARAAFTDGEYMCRFPKVRAGAGLNSCFGSGRRTPRSGLRAPAQPSCDSSRSGLLPR